MKRLTLCLFAVLFTVLAVGQGPVLGTTNSAIDSAAIGERKDPTSSLPEPANLALLGVTLVIAGITLRRQPTV